MAFEKLNPESELEKNNRRVLLLLQIPSHGIRADKIGEAPGVMHSTIPRNTPGTALV